MVKNNLVTPYLRNNTFINRTKIQNKHELFEQVFQAILRSGEDGVFQTKISKEFSLDSREGSRLAGILEKQSLISREKILHKGRWTYKLKVKKSGIAEYNGKLKEIESVEQKHVHDPGLKTIKMVENELRENNFFTSKNSLWRSLPKQTQYPTFCKVLDYLEESNKITYDKDGNIIWIFVESEKAQKSLGESSILNSYDNQK